MPFGTETQEGQVVPGRTKCTTGVLRCDPDGGNLELLAWGLRNAFGLLHHPDGRLFATEHGIDERGARFIIGDPDDFYEVIAGTWYGYPDYASGRHLDDEQWGDGGRGREPVIAEPPGAPPEPYVSFTAHAAANCFGDAAPVTTRRIVPAGFKVVRVDMAERKVVDFAVNRIAGGASILPHNGFERPVDCRFGPDGYLYVVDWGEMVPAPERGGVEIRLGTGMVWRIRRAAGAPSDHGDAPPAPLVLPVNLLRAVLPVAGMVAVAAVVRAVHRARRRRRRG
ncbi:MAG: PQQ-dependent sugar dehydrogenase [Actinomycetota bacterium]|nr:PQQ-dependent sugar dehydrogenase [Actinomycetota bacterium]